MKQSGTVTPLPVAQGGFGQILSTYWRALVPILVWLIIILIPLPAGLTLNAWFFFALFAAVIVALILEPLPGSVVALIGIAVAVAMRYVAATPAASIAWGLSGFADTTVWLIFGAFMFALGYEKTGLGRRIALLLVKTLGSRTLGIGYAIGLADLILAPGTPSNTGRSAGTIYPVVRNIPALYGSEPGPTARKIGGYLMWTAFAVQAVTSSMFITALAPNVLAVSLVKKTIDISWNQWFMGFLPMGVILFLAAPLIVYWLYPPEIKASKEVPVWAAQELGKMGRISVKEITLAVLILLAIGLWIWGGDYVNATAVVILVIALMLVTGVVKWEEMLAHKSAWNVLVWFATLVALADGLNKVGFVTWFAKGAAAMMTGIPAIWVMVLLVVIFFIIHYMFASLTAHTTAVLPVILAAGIAVPGLPAKAFAMLLCYSLGLMGILTPYATGPSPVYFNSGFISRKDFWVLGLVFGLIYLIVLLAIGVPWLTSGQVF